MFTHSTDADWDRARRIFDDAVAATLLVIERDFFSRFWDQEGPRLDPYLSRCCLAPSVASTSSGPLRFK